MYSVEHPYFYFINALPTWSYVISRAPLLVSYFINSLPTRSYVFSRTPTLVILLTLGHMYSVEYQYL